MPDVILLAGFKALAEREAATPEGRTRIVFALQETLAALEGPPRLRRDVMTPGVASALRAMSEGLTVAAEGCAHIADHGLVILPPPVLRRPGRR